MKIRSAAAALLSMLMLTACGQSAAPEDTQTETAAEAVTEMTAASEAKAPETEEEFHEAMVARSLYSVGNTSRLHAKMEKARSGEKTTVAYIGGSITEGAGATPVNCYAKLSYNYFAETYGTGDNVEYVNAGLSGTPSELGNLRLERDVLSHEPDIVFVEFAVNDSQDKVSKESYESLVKTVLMQENEPAVVLIFTILENGYTAQEHMKEIGELYDLPMVSVADAIKPELDEGRLAWKDYSADSSHPNEYGHELVCEFISNMYKAAEATPPEDYKVSMGFKYGAPYENAVMIIPSSEENENISVTDLGSFEPVSGGAPGFPESWCYNGGDAPMKLHVKGNSFFIVIKRNNKDSMGSFDVLMDGKKLSTVNTNQENGWGESFPEQIIKFQSVKDMDIEIVPSEGSRDKEITLLAFACSQNVTM